MENNKKVITRLSGGMGNQLHQYAYALVLGKKYGCKVYVDKSFFKLSSERLKITKRKYELHHFLIAPAEFNFFLSNYYIFNIINRVSLFRFLLEKIMKIKIINSRQAENTTYKNVEVFYINGVFGSVSDYKTIFPEIKTLFLPNLKVKEDGLAGIGKLINKNRSVAVHIRRTDYLNADSIHEVLSVSYYLKAIDLMQKKIKDPTFYFFGDDEKWIRENLIELNNPKYIHVSRSHANSHLFDFFAINYCENIIISNSTFAWWAAYLNDNNGKIIIAPNKWLKNQQLDLTEFYLNDWHVI